MEDLYDGFDFYDDDKRVYYDEIVVAAYDAGCALLSPASAGAMADGSGAASSHVPTSVHGLAMSPDGAPPTPWSRANPSRPLEATV